jgi:glycosyltransferase involved in cell wall biosynthesis
MFKIKSKKNFIFIDRNPLSLTKMTEFFMPRIIDKIKTRKDVNILTVDYGSQKLHKDLFGIDIRLTPVLTYFEKTPNANELTDIGVFSVYRNTIAQMASFYKMFSEFPKITFHIHDPWGAIQKRDKKLFKGTKNINFFEFEFDLSKKISSFQAVINHLFPNLYKYLNSGILCETMAVGRPLITSKNTSTSHYIEKYKNGLLYDYWDFSQIANSILLLSINYSEYKKNAENLSVEWENLNGLDKIVELTL